MTWNYILPKETLEGYRKAAGSTQEEMAHHMHMPLRTYEDLVNGKTQLRPIHSRAAEGALLFLARKRGDATFLPPHLRELVADVSALIQQSESNTFVSEARGTRQQGGQED